jgi:predicted dehydrogenase
MKSIIIGGGSIGKRHSNNLKDLGIETRIVDIDEISNIDDILKSGFDFGLVCSPNNLHIEHCTKLAENDIPFFCEKPLFSLSSVELFADKIESLMRICEEKKLINMVGCNLRFTKEVQSLPHDTKYVNVYFGYNLKKWRPNQNHLDSYSSNKSMGGGIFFDAIHEFDYLYHKFGEIAKMKTICLKLSNITNDTEDVAITSIAFSNGTIANVHLNYLSDEYTRYYEYLKDDSLFRVNLNVSNEMYVDEMKYFVDCVKTKTQSTNTIMDALYLITKMGESHG